MPDEFVPKKAVRLAKPGEVAGFGRAIRRDVIDPDYAAAAPLAYANPGQPVIVHEWRRPDDEVRRKELYRLIAEETRITLPLMNDADKAKELDHDDGVVVMDIPDGTLERFQVSISAGENEAWRTYVIFHPNGRPVRASRKRLSEQAMEDLEAEEARQAALEANGTDEHGNLDPPLGEDLAVGGGPVTE